MKGNPGKKQTGLKPYFDSRKRLGESMASRRLFMFFLIAAFIILDAGWQPAITRVPGLAQVASSQAAASGSGIMQTPLITKDFAVSQISGVDQHIPAVAYNSKHDEYLVT